MIETTRGDRYKFRQVTHREWIQSYHALINPVFKISVFQVAYQLEKLVKHCYHANLYANTGTVDTMFDTTTEVPLVILNLGNVDYPFVVGSDMWSDKKCLLHPFDFMLPVYSIYEDGLPTLYTEHIGGESPIYLRRCRVPNTTFRTWLQQSVHSNMIPHFFGEKSQRVRWDYVPPESDTAFDVVLDTLDVYQHHTQEFLKKPTDSPINLLIHDNTNHWTLGIIKEDCFGWVAAYEVSTHRYVAAMKVAHFNNSLGCFWLASNNPNQELRPYSLAICAHLAVMRVAIEQGLDYIDLGTNYDAYGDYKDVIDHDKLPFLNVPAFRDLADLL